MLFIYKNILLYSILKKILKPLNLVYFKVINILKGNNI